MFDSFLNDVLIGSVIEINHLYYYVITANNHSKDSVSLVNFEDSTYLRHRFGVLLPSSKPEQATDDPNFSIDSSFIPELTPNGILLRCTNPGFEKLYISRKGENLIIDQNNPEIFSPLSQPQIDDRLEFSNQIYIVCPANNGKIGAFSLRKHGENSFLRHSYGVITATQLDPEEDRTVFNDDSTFILCPTPDGIRLKCTNPGLEDHYVAVKKYGETVISSKSEIDASLLSQKKSNDYYTQSISKNTETPSNTENASYNTQKSEGKNTFSDSAVNESETCQDSELKYAVAKIHSNRAQILTELRLCNALRMLTEFGNICSEMRSTISDLKSEFQNSVFENQKLQNRIGILENLASIELIKMQKSTGNTPLISVIIPVYNGEQYLRECLNSLLSQTFNNFELILINDGSTDETEKILEEYSLRDQRIKIITTDHNGAGKSRNRGLEEIRGKYVSILDADDIYAPQMLMTLYATAESDNLDIAVCRSEKITGNNVNSREKMLWTVTDQYLPQNRVFSATDVAKHIFQLFNGWTWDKLFSAKFIKALNLRFQDTSFSNDAFFTYMALCSAERIGIVDEYLVIHRYHENSIEARRCEDPIKFIDVFKAILAELEKSGKIKNYRLSFCNWVASFTRWQYETQDEESKKLIQNAASSFISENRINENLTRIYTNSDTLWLANHTNSKIPEVSIIMPVYNSEMFLEETIRSIREQTMKNFEVICIDDGSNDRSLEILENIAKEDLRFRILTQKNHGAGAARNKGLELARGRYLAFMDSDDLYNKDFLEIMLSQSRRLDTDITVCRYIRFFHEYNTEDIPRNDINMSLLPRKEVFSPQDIRKDFFQVFIPVVWNKLFKREFIERNAIKFQEIQNSNDTYFVYCALLESASITAIDKRLIRYRMRADSLVRTRRIAPECYLLAQQALKEKVESMGLMNDDEFRNSLDLRILKNTEWNKKMAAT
jgi:glycosyltransferase involved in cell wall biosynthesis